MGEILVGTASWTDKTLIESGWYPPEAKTAEKRLKYYAAQFPLVEVDSTYYFPPSEANSERWVERTPDDFTFNIKAFSLLTGHPTRTDALYKDLDVQSDKRNVYPKDLDKKVIDTVWDRFLSALEPLDEAGKLGILLFQFPPWFTIARRNKDYVLECAKRTAPLKIAVELRNQTWMDGDNEKETLEFLEGHGLPFVCVDMPQGFRSSMPPVTAATSDLALLRFHGHNDDEWESKSVSKRFRYHYSEDELEEWVPRIAKLNDEADRTHILMNNCYRDYATTNATDLSELLRASGLDVPEGTSRPSDQ
ncbi:MAG TPA: DUF72 domain-containing protein [Actinomycetota bacterium]|nr:DUF72 domain-containing protein [Actinomycetota bacterium]